MYICMYTLLRISDGSEGADANTHTPPARPATDEDVKDSTRRTALVYTAQDHTLQCTDRAQPSLHCS